MTFRFSERRELAPQAATGVGLFGDSDGEYFEIVYRGSAHVLGRWLDADDHMHIENRKPRRRRKAVSPFCHFGGVYPFVIRL